MTTSSDFNTFPYPGAPGDLFQDDEGTVFVHCADGRFRALEDVNDSYTGADLDDDRGPMLSVGTGR